MILALLDAIFKTGLRFSNWGFGRSFCDHFSVMMCCPEFFAEGPCGMQPVWVCVAGKGVWWMPWQTVPMKDVWGRDRPRGAADRALIRGFPNGGTRRPYGPAPHSCGGYAGK